LVDAEVAMVLSALLVIDSALDTFVKALRKPAVVAKRRNALQCGLSPVERCYKAPSY
jgi:hypothetical protein